MVIAESQYHVKSNQDGYLKKSYMFQRRILDMPISWHVFSPPREYWTVCTSSAGCCTHDSSGQGWEQIWKKQE